MDKRMYETHEQWSGMTRENFFREFRAFQEQRTATLDKITFVGQELLTISKNFAQTDAEVVQTSARGGLDLNLMINEQKRGYAQAQTDEERDAYSQEADRIRDAMRQQGYDESEIMQKTDPAMSEDQVMARAWDETRKWAEADPKGFGLMFAGRPLVQGAIANIEAARNTYNEARKGEIVKAIVDYAKGYTNFYTDLGYKLAESASNPGETVDKLTHSPAQAKTEFIASLASGLIFGRHMKKEHHGEGGSGGRKPGAGEGTQIDPSVGSLVKDGSKSKYTNSAGNELTWVDQHPKNINRDIENFLNSPNVGKATEAKVANFVRSETEVVGFGQKILKKDGQPAGDLDVVTKNAIIEVKASIKAVDPEQFLKMTKQDYPDFFNPENKKIILYIDKPMTNLRSEHEVILEEIKSQGVIIVNSLEGLKGVLK
ncbi:WXG100 family type VII secretion target [Paenibacillus sp. SAF-054]|uniref:WXG100 family type VII secretion target n=1 Tax=unclassified Paenibacillus TaxID=185978 RepID=UPI003F81AB34